MTTVSEIRDHHAHCVSRTCPARDGDAGALHRRLHRFETLTSAVWTVQLAMPDGPGYSPDGRRGQSLSSLVRPGR
jgi:hypothetical protein